MGVNGKPVGNLDLYLNLAEMRQPPLLSFLSRVTDTVKTERAFEGSKQDH